MIHTSIWLAAINVTILLIVGMIRQKNPFDLWVVFLLGLANLGGFLAAAVLTHTHPTQALASLVGNLLPLIVTIIAICLPLLMISLLYRRSRSRS